MGKKPYPRLQDYTVGWIAALPVELAAALEMIDEEHPLPEDFPRDDDDGNLYVFGRIGSHNIVFSSLPAGTIGTNSAASLAIHLRTKCKQMTFGLLVGIAGAAPSSSHDIRLGDVVVSTPNEQFGGVVQWDFGKSTSGGLFHRTGHLNAPPQALLNNLAYIRARELMGKLSVSEHLSVFDMLPTFNRAKAGPDILYEGETPKARPQRNSTDPVVHYGTIASGNQVIKDSITRDRLSQELNGALCFEMEAAGLMNSFPCLVIRGMCDYADEHKNKSWQPYAAATAAAWAKQFLSVLPASSSESGEMVSLNAETSQNLDHAPEGNTGLTELHEIVSPTSRRARISIKLQREIWAYQEGQGEVDRGRSEEISNTQVELSFKLR
jgi:nucleoside phosphorylase